MSVPENRTIAPPTPVCVCIPLLGINSEVFQVKQNKIKQTRL